MAKRDLTVLYWPVTTAGGNFCAQNGTVVTASPTITGKPNTAVYEGRTVTSPTVYYIYGTVSAVDTNTGRMCGNRANNVSVAVQPEDIVMPVDITTRSSIIQTTTKFNWDYVNDMPWSIYSPICQQRSEYTLSEDCQTVWGHYKAELAVPTALTRAQNQWTECDLYDLTQTVNKWIPLAPKPTLPRTPATAAPLVTAT